MEWLILVWRVNEAMTMIIEITHTQCMIVSSQNSYEYFPAHFEEATPTDIIIEEFLFRHEVPRHSAGEQG